MRDNQQAQPGETDWPDLPSIPATPTIDFLKLLYAAQVDWVEKARLAAHAPPAGPLPSGGAASISAAEPAWPDPPSQPGADPLVDFHKALFQAKVDVIKARKQADLDATKLRQQAEIDAAKAQVSANAAALAADYGAYYDSQKALYQSYLDTAKASVDRVQARATGISAAATTISTLYTGFLGFLFAAKVDKDTPRSLILPTRGVAPMLFLALAIVLAIIYLSFITRRRDATNVETSGLLAEDAIAGLDGYIDWVKAIIEPRLPFLQGAVVSLGVGVALLPVAFLNIPAFHWWRITIAEPWIIGGVCLLGLLGIAALIIVQSVRQNHQPVASPTN
jgi:hypothetical protein